MSDHIWRGHVPLEGTYSFVIVLFICVNVWVEVTEKEKTVNYRMVLINLSYHKFERRDEVGCLW